MSCLLRNAEVPKPRYPPSTSSQPRWIASGIGERLRRDRHRLPLGSLRGSFDLINPLPVDGSDVPVCADVVPRVTVVTKGPVGDGPMRVDFYIGDRLLGSRPVPASG